MARYDSLRKTERDQEVWDYYQTHPDLSLTEVGASFTPPLSRQAVWIIITKPKFKQLYMRLKELRKKQGGNS